jgi:hypothetical protein
MQNSSYDQMIANSAYLLIFALTEPISLFTEYFVVGPGSNQWIVINVDLLRNLSASANARDHALNQLLGTVYERRKMTRSQPKGKTNWFTNSQYRAAQIRISLLPPEL